MAAPININANLNLNPASINASAKQVQQALGRITGQASEFQKSLDASTARVFAFGATTSVINGITQSFRALVTTTINVEAKLKEINSILGAGASEFNKYRNSIFQVAKSTGQSFKTVAEGAAELARQGLGAAESAKRLEAALILTRISGLGAEQSVKALTAAMNGFTSAGLTASQVVNKIVAVDTAFAVSAQDLADGFSRAGSTAEDAGVSFDELLGLITAVEQRTARGGAVIGNAFKSIFTRLSRGSTIEDLQSLGVAIDANQTGVQKLKALSDALQKISDPTVASQIKELAGGVFQINVVSAALKDIGNEASVFGEATKTSFNAINEATEKNNALNDTLLAKLNSLVVSATSLGEKIGQLTFAPLLGSLVGIATKLSEGLDKALDPEKGNKFIQGIFKVIGGFLSGPGLAIFTVAFVKIFRTVLRFAREGFKTVMQMGSASERIKNVEGGIVALLQKDVGLRKILSSATATQAQKEQAVITAIQKENALLTQQEALVRRIATQASARGVRGFSPSGGFTGKKGKRFAAGGEGQMEPNLMSAMVNEAREAPKGASPYLTNFRGKPAVMNTSEMQVRINGREEILREDQIPRFNKGSGKRKLFKGKKGGAEGTRIANNKERGDRFVFLTPEIDQRSSFGPMTVDKTKYDSVHQIHGIKSSQIKDVSNKEEDSLETKIKNNLFKEAADWTSRIKPLDKSAPVSEIKKGFDSIRGAKGALNAAVGSAFEVGISKSLKYEARERDAGGDFDVRGGPNISKIQKLFGIRQKIGDFKNSSSKGNQRSFIRKVRREQKAGAFTKQEVDRQTAKTAEREGTSTRVARRKVTSAQRASRGPKIPFKAKGSIPNYAVGSIIRGGINLVRGGGKSSSKLFGGGMKKASPLKKFRHSKVGKSMEESGNIGGSIGLSMLSTQMGSGVDALEEEGQKGKAALLDMGADVASFAATGAAIGGPIGAGVGALVGLGVAAFKMSAEAEAAAERLEQAQKTAEKLGEIQSTINKNIGPKESIGNVMSKLKSVGEMGFKDLDISNQFKNAMSEAQILATEKPSEDRSQKQIDADYARSLEKLNIVTERAGRIAKASNALSRKVNRLKELEAKILKFKSQNEGKALKAGVEKQKVKLDDAAALMKGNQGKFAGIINRDIAIGQKKADAGIAKGELEDLKTQLRISTNPAEKAKLDVAIKKASENFNQKVKDAAIFMAQKQTEIINRQAEVAKESAALQRQAIETAISGISQGVKGDKIDLDAIGAFRKDFKSAKTDEERAKRIAEFEGTTLAGQSDEMKNALRKAAGLASGDGRELIDEKGLRRIEAKSRIEGGTAEDRASFAKYLPSRSTDGRRADLDAVAAALAAQSERLSTQMDDFGKAFKAEAVTAEMKKIRASLEQAAKNAKTLAAATGVVTSIGETVNSLVTRVDVNLKEQEKKIAVLEGDRGVVKKETQDILDSLGAKTN